MLNPVLPATSYQLQPSYAWALIATLAAAIVAFFVSLQTGVLILTLGVLAWWVWQAPVSGFFFLLVISPLLPLFKVTQSVGSITLVKDIIILTLVARLVAFPLLRQNLPYRRNILFAPLLLLFFWIAQAALRADSAILGVLRAREVVLYALVYVAALYLPATRRFYRELTLWLSATFAVVAVLALFQWFFAQDSTVLRFDPARQIWIPRVSSTFGHPSVFGQYLIALFTVFLAWLLTTRPARHSLIPLAGVAVSLPLIYLTYSRAVWLGLLTAVAAMVITALLARFRAQKIWHLPWRHVLITFVIMGAGLFGIIHFTQVGVFLTSAFDTQYRSNQERLEFLARLVAPTTNSEALIGRGLGNVTAQNFREVELQSVDIATTASRNVQQAKNSTLVDNQYLKTFVELGLLGLLIYAWLFKRIFSASFSLVSREQQGVSHVYQILGLTSFGFMTAFIVQAPFIDIWDIFPTNMLFWIVAGLVSAAVGRSAKV